MRRSKVARRDSSMESFDFYDTYNPRHNKVDQVHHVEWPVLSAKPTTHRVNMGSYRTRSRRVIETRSPFLTELSPDV